MFEQDYLMRIMIQFAQAIRRSMERATEQNNPESAAETIELAVGEATEIDGDTLLSLAPESMTSVMQVSGTDPKIAEFIARSLELESHYLREANNSDKAKLRSEQARSIAVAYGFDLPEIPFSEEELVEFIESQEDVSG